MIIYNLAAQSHVRVSFDIPEYTAQVDAVGTLRFLDAIKEAGLKRQDSFLSSFYFRTLWKSSRDSSEG